MAASLLLAGVPPPPRFHRPATLGPALQLVLGHSFRSVARCTCRLRNFSLACLDDLSPQEECSRGYGGVTNPSGPVEIPASSRPMASIVRAASAGGGQAMSAMSLFGRKTEPSAWPRQAEISLAVVSLPGRSIRLSRRSRADYPESHVKFDLSLERRTALSTNSNQSAYKA